MEDIDLFLVRVWRGLPRFRASARRIDDEVPQMFATLDDLAQFLAGPVEAPTASPGTPDRDERTTGGSTQ